MTAQEEIKSIMADNDLSLNWLASRLGSGWNKQKVFYMLNTAIDIKQSDYNHIMSIFHSHGYSSTPENNMTVLERSADINAKAGRLIQFVIQSLEDGTISDAERNTIRQQLKEMKTELNKILEVL